MLLLAFKRLGHSSFLQPTAALEFRGGELVIAGASAPLARYSLGQWLYGGQKWDYVECSTRILVRLEGFGGPPGPVIGRYPSMRLRDRFVFGGRQRIATLISQTARWQLINTQESWPVLRVISDPPRDAVSDPS